MTIFEEVTTALGVNGIEPYTTELTMAIEAAIDDLRTIGVECPPFDISMNWDVFPDGVKTGVSLLGSIKQYIYITVRLIFDPPMPSVINSFERRQQSTIFHIQTHYDNTKLTEEG